MFLKGFFCTQVFCFNFPLELFYIFTGYLKVKKDSSSTFISLYSNDNIYFYNSFYSWSKILKRFM
jgi:hypothetical protein